MSLPWVRIDATLPANHKILELVDKGRWRSVSMYVFAITYSGHNTTDGYIPRAALPLIHGTVKDAQHLVAAGLWHPHGNGWMIHDWHDYQPSSEYVKGKRTAGKKHACKRWHPPGCTCWMDGSPNAEPNAEPNARNGTERN